MSSNRDLARLTAPEHAEIEEAGFAGVLRRKILAFFGHPLHQLRIHQIGTPAGFGQRASPIPINQIEAETHGEELLPHVGRLRRWSFNHRINPSKSAPGEATRRWRKVDSRGPTRLDIRFYVAVKSRPAPVP